MHKNNPFPRLPGTLGGILLATALPAHAYEMADLGHATVDIGLQALHGTFHSERGYYTGAAEPRRYHWQAGVITLGAELNPKEGGLYGRVSTLGTVTWDDGDAAGFASGNERELGLEMGGRELDLSAEWLPRDWLYVSPLLGWYAPDRSAAQGGIQLDDDDTALYAQLLVGSSYDA